MAVTKENVERFHEFAQQKLDTAETELSWDELLIAWQSACERESPARPVCSGRNQRIGAFRNLRVVRQFRPVVI